MVIEKCESVNSFLLPLGLGLWIAGTRLEKRPTAQASQPLMLPAGRGQQVSATI